MIINSLKLNAWKIIFLKTCLIFSGFFLIYNVSENAYAVVILCASTIFSYCIAYFFRNRESIISKIMGRSIVPLTFLFIIVLNVSGFIGTLTGSSNNQTNASLLLGAPFYFLSAAAFISDVCLKKQSYPSLLNYFVYITLPFKLLAGPLEPPRLLNQIKTWSPRLTWWKFGIAWPWIVLGTFMKFVIANRLAPSLNLEFTTPLTTIITAAIFELKFYFDFAGYSFMGYGFALLCGFRINQNFRHPFFASNVIFFWHRWHISLGQFLRRYILEPNLNLCSSRNKKLIFASSIFFVSAVWHGGTMNYALWGLFHGGIYFVYITFFKKKNIPKLIGYLSMILFFIFGRFLAVDSNYKRLDIKIDQVLEMLINFDYIIQLSNIEYSILSMEFNGIGAAIIFLILEAISLRFYSLSRPYHLLRKPIIALSLFIVILFYGLSSGSLLYARI